MTEELNNFLYLPLELKKIFFKLLPIEQQGLLNIVFYKATHFDLLLEGAFREREMQIHPPVQSFRSEFFKYIKSTIYIYFPAYIDFDPSLEITWESLRNAKSRDFYLTPIPRNLKNLTGYFKVQVPGKTVFASECINGVLKYSKGFKADAIISFCFLDKSECPNPNYEALKSTQLQLCK